MVDLLAPIMLASLVVVLLAGFPVAFSLAAIAGIFGLLGVLTRPLRCDFPHCDDVPHSRRLPQR